MQAVTAPSLYQIHEVDPVLVVGFGPDGTPNHCYHPECLSELLDLCELRATNRLVFDLGCVHCLVSGLLGLFCSLRRHGIEVRLWRPHNALRPVLESLGWDELFVDDPTSFTTEEVDSRVPTLKAPRERV